MGCYSYFNAIKNISLLEAYNLVKQSYLASDYEKAASDLWQFVPYCKVNDKFLGEKVPGYSVSFQNLSKFNELIA